MYTYFARLQFIVLIKQATMRNVIVIGIMDVHGIATRAAYVLV